MRAQGLPYELRHPHRHLRAAHNLYSDPSQRKTLRITAHDEKDIKRSQCWLVDLGDGEAQTTLREYNAAVAAVASEVDALKALPAQSSLSAVDYSCIHGVLAQHTPLLVRYGDLGQSSTDRWKQRVEALERLIRKKGPGHKDCAGHTKTIGTVWQFFAVRPRCGRQHGVATSFRRAAGARAGRVYLP